MSEGRPGKRGLLLVDSGVRTILELECQLPKEDEVQSHSKLPGHPELGLAPGVKSSSGRLGHMCDGSLNQAALDPQASTGTQTQASAARAASQDIDSQASIDAQAQALRPAQSAPKWPKERAAAPDPGFDPINAIIDGELTPHSSPVPKRPKQAATTAADKPKSAPASEPKQGIRKSTRNKH
ncbi:hypothetical protein JOM56_013690 [Amanita muscaria]